MKVKTPCLIKGILSSLVLIIILSFSPQNTVSSHFTASTSQLAAQGSIVYITKTGTKYHKSNCRYLKQSKIKISLKKASAAGLIACKICKP